MVWKTLYNVVTNVSGKVFEGVQTKTGEKIADVAIDTGGRVLEFESDLQRLEQNSKMLSSIASDVRTVVNNEEQSGRKKRKREVKDWMDEEPKIQQDVKTLLDDIQQHKRTSRFRIARVGEMNKRVKEHIKLKNDFGDELVLDDHDHRGEKFLLGNMYGTGFQRNLEQIFNYVNPGGTEIIGIYGAAEAGKTELAKHVHNRLLDDETAGRVYWVRVSETMSIRKLQDDISHEIDLNISEVTDEARRASRLYEALRRRPFVLILDNLKERVNFRDVGIPVDVDGCRLVITTPSYNVCMRIGCRRTFEVKMNEDEAWDMFKEEYGQDASSDLQQEGDLNLKSVVESLCGFPKKIIELAEILKIDGLRPGSREWRYQLEEFVGFR